MFKQVTMEWLNKACSVLKASEQVEKQNVEWLISFVAFKKGIFGDFHTSIRVCGDKGCHGWWIEYTGADKQYAVPHIGVVPFNPDHREDRVKKTHYLPGKMKCSTKNMKKIIGMALWLSRHGFQKGKYHGLSKNCRTYVSQFWDALYDSAVFFKSKIILEDQGYKTLDLANYLGYIG